MAEDDEVDVLGDYNLGNILCRNDSAGFESTSLISQNGDLLNCDYTIHPQWLLDKPSANPDNWYNSDKPSGSNEGPESEISGHVSTENCITDESGWTEKEKKLLETGIEIFGKSNMRLSQFIGSKTPAEVKYYLKNFYLENHGNLALKQGIVEGVSTDLVSDVLNANQIPASIEEVIAAVSTGKPTVHGNSRLRKKSSTFSCQKVHSPERYKEAKQFSPSRSRNDEPLKDYSSKKLKKKQKMFEKGDLNEKPVKFKIKTKLKMPSTKNDSVVKQKTMCTLREQNKSEFSRIEITTGKGLAVPICEGEEIVKLKKVNDESDTDVDIDVEISDDESQKNKGPDQNCPAKNESLGELVIPSTGLRESNVNVELKSASDLPKISERGLELLNSMETPKSEVVLKHGHVADIEKVVHSEYFVGNASKSPGRYLQIRNHIIKGWFAQKPEYLKKTASRHGLKNCGDVNRFGRIHHLLEQIGAINFGCEQVTYIRPLSKLLKVPSTVKEKSCPNEEKPAKRPLSDLGVRQRIKKKFPNDGEGGCTLTHDEKGKVINTTIVNEGPTVKQRVNLKKPCIRLIYCRPFMADKPQPYSIKIYLSTVLTMDFHAHLSLTEVMGLVAGYWIPESSTLIITHYEPTLRLASSATHCDMCPISQAKAAETIHEMELDILGWYHSHPTFAPEPSRQDLETQQTVQQWIGHKNPCVGVILSPFSFNGALIASPYRCMIVEKRANFENHLVPYKFEVEVFSDGFNLEDFLFDLKKMLKFDTGCGRVELDKPYFLDPAFTYLEKYITSVRMHLAKCGTLNRPTCEEVIEGITKLFESKGVR